LGSDNIIAGALYGAASASVFYSTKMFGSLVIQLISRLIDNTYPALNEMIGKDKHAAVKCVYLRMLRYVLLLSIPAALAIAVFSSALVTLWVGEKQFAGHVMAVSLSLFVFVQILNHLHGIMALALGNLRHWPAVSIASGLLSVALGYTMGKILGMQWILLGITLAMLPIFVLLVYRVFYALKIKAAEVLSNVLPALYACAPLLTMIWLSELLIATPTLQNVAATLIIYFLLWITGTWFLGVNSIEKAQVRRLAVKALQRT
jgi:O-antigen/teichoic acid export membrane protein